MGPLFFAVAVALVAISGDPPSPAAPASAEPPKTDEPKTEEPKKDEPKKDEPKKDEPKKEGESEKAAAPEKDAPPAVRKIDTSALTFEIEPARITLGETLNATVKLRAQRPDGIALDVSDPRVTVSAGAVGNLKRVSAGTWTVNYTPPKPGPPQVAVMVAAIDAGASDIVGVTTIALWGKGETVVRTEPKSDVTVRAGPDTFGPVKADDKGVARVPLAIRPGVTQATTISLDEAKNTSERTIDLKVPPFNRVALLPLDEATVNDGTGIARFVAVTVDASGALQTDPSLTAKASTGEAVVTGELGPGLQQIVLSPGKTKATEADVTVSLDAKHSAARAEIPLVPGRAVNARITLSRVELSEDDRIRVIKASVALVDGADRPVPPQGAGVSVDLGRLASFTRDKDGTRHAQWIVPVGSGLEKATLTVHLPNGDALGTADVKLIPSVTAPALPPPPAPRPMLLAGGGLLVGSNYSEVLAIGAELSVYGRLSALETPLYLGGSIGAMQALLLPSDVAEHRAFPLLGEVHWRPSAAQNQLHFLLGAGLGPVFSDMVRSPGGPHIGAMAFAGQLTVGAGYPVGPGSIDAFFRLGTSIYPFGGGATGDAVGLPLGVSLVVAYRFGFL